jgi:hypothetical protein
MAVNIFGDADCGVAESLGHHLQRHALGQEGGGRRVAKSVRVPVAQAIAESLGGSVEFHPTNLAVQWGRTGLLDAAKQLGLV